MNIPLINTNDKESINTSLIAIKRATEELNNLIKIADEKMAQLDEKAKKYTDDKINALDVASVGGSGKYISAISETDGKISATASDITSTVSSGNSQPVTSGGVYNLTSINTKTSKADANLCYSDSTRVEFFRLPTNASNCPPSNDTNPTYIEAFTFNNGTSIRVTQKAYDNYSGVASYIRSGYSDGNNITWNDWQPLTPINGVTNGNLQPATSNAVYEGLIKKQDTRFGTFFAAGSYNSGYCLLLVVANSDSTGNHEVGFQCVVDIFAGNTISSVLVNVLVRGAGTAVNVKTFTTLIMGGHYGEDYAGRIKATYQVVNNHYVVRLWGFNNAYWQRYNIKLLKVWNTDCMYQGDIFESKVLIPCSHENALTGTEITRYSMNTLS